MYAAALYDSASSVSVLSPTFCKRMGIEWTRRSIRLDTMSSLGAVSEGIVRIEVTINGISHEISFEIIENDIASVLLGLEVWL